MVLEWTFHMWSLHFIIFQFLPLCKEAYKGCLLAETDLSKNNIEHILSLHNNLRTYIAENETNMPKTAANMLKIEWNIDIAQIASKRLQSCEFRGCERYCDEESKKLKEKCNYHTFSLLSDNSNKSTANLIKESFEYSIWNLTRNKISEDLIKYYQYTSEYDESLQIIWSNSWKIGCALHVAMDASIFMKLLCLYCPERNIPGQPVYEFGPACSKCPVRFKCDDTYTSLCSYDFNSSPIRDFTNETNTTGTGGGGLNPAILIAIIAVVAAVIIGVIACIVIRGCRKKRDIQLTEQTAGLQE